MNPIQRRIADYEKILSNSVWRETAFLRMLADRMRHMLSRLKIAEATQPSDYSTMPIYVLLYHQSGEDLSVWENMLKRIRYSIERRPVFLSLSEAKHALEDKFREGIVILDMPKSSIVGAKGKRYLKPENVKIGVVKGLIWGGKTFHFNRLSLIEMNSEIV